MRCPFPILIKNKYGYIREVPCGQCSACRLNHASEFAIRIMDECKCHKDNCFLTLTYDEESLPERGSLVKFELQLFQKRLRKAVSPRKLRFYSVGEYGDMYGRCHYHLIVFGLSPVDDIFKNKEYDKEHDGWRSHMDIWKFGFVFSCPVTYDDACYVAKYCMKKLTGEKGRQFYEDRGIEPPFVMMSNRPGIGYDFLKANAKRIERHGYVIGKNGKKCPVPRYYAEKIWTDYGRFVKSTKKIHDDLVVMREKAEKQNKNINAYADEILKAAEEKVKSFIKMKGKRDEF